MDNASGDSGDVSMHTMYNYTKKFLVGTVPPSLGREVPSLGREVPSLGRLLADKLVKKGNFSYKCIKLNRARMALLLIYI